MWYVYVRVYGEDDTFRKSGQLCCCFTKVQSNHSHNELENQITHYVPTPEGGGRIGGFVLRGFSVKHIFWLKWFK